MYNRFYQNNHTKHGFDRSSIFSQNTNAVPIWVILNMTEEEYYIKYRPIVEIKPILSQTEDEKK